MSVDEFQQLKQQELLERMTSRSVESTDRRRRPQYDSIDSTIEHKVRLKPELSFRENAEMLEGTHRSAMSVMKKNHGPKARSIIRREDQLNMTASMEQTERALMAHDTIKLEIQKQNDSFDAGINSAMHITEQYRNSASSDVDGKLDKDVSALHKLTSMRQEQYNSTGNNSIQSTHREHILSGHQSAAGRYNFAPVLKEALQTNGSRLNSARKQQDSSMSRQQAELQFIQGFVAPYNTQTQQNNTAKKERNRDASQGVNYAKSRDINRAFLKQAKSSLVEVAISQTASRLGANSTPLKNHKEEVESPVKDSNDVRDRLICLIKTNEPHIRRAVERRSAYWVENRQKNNGATIYDVKFEFQDQPADYSNLNLRPCQIFNHFQNNTELTTKSGLARSLYTNTHPQLRTDKWFPRCYDLSLAGQTDELLDDYLRTSAQIIIKRHNAMFKQFCGEQMKKALADVQKLRSLRDQGIAAYNYRDQKADIMWHLVQSLPCPPNVLVNTKMLERSLKFIKQLLANETGAPNDLVKDELRPHDQKGLSGWHGQGPLSKMYSEKTWQQLLQYSKTSLPITDFAHLPPDLVPNKKDLKALQQFVDNLERTNGQCASKQDRALAYTAAMAGWERPTLYLIYKIHKYHELLKKSLPQYSMDGSNNVWIVKPCYNARGFGIYCIDNCLQEFQNPMVQSQTKSRIVQKYIEKPLLLHHFNETRKFDIRQWVLVTSFDPLKIYMFSEFYLRICGSKYDLGDISDAYKHLTNFSIQKHNNKVGNKETDLVMSQAEFFRKVFKNDAVKCQKVRKGIEDIIVKTVRSGQEAGIEHKPNCFEMYGFDFMLDRKLNPWLLEVNLSPACAERTEWLVDMLDRMTDGLFDMIEQKLPKVTDDFKGELKTYLQKRRKENLDNRDDGWNLIYDQQKQSSNWKNHEAHLQAQQDKPPSVLNYNNIDVQGTKINNRAERRVQQLHVQVLAARIIQRRWRGYLGRKKLMNLKFELIVVYIQSFVRMFLAKRQRQRLAQEKYSVVVQKYLRKYLARKHYFRLLAEAYDAMKVRKVCQIQRVARIFIGKVRVERQIRQASALVIQKRARGIIARRQVARYRHLIEKVKLIQQFYRDRLALKHWCAVSVQKFLRGRRVFKRCRRLAKVKQATVAIASTEKVHQLKAAVTKWHIHSRQMTSAIKIQRAVKRFLKRRRKTVNRTRCMQFYWRKFCRLIKYYRCWEACKLIKDRMKHCVNLIQSQYNVLRFRRLMAVRIKHSKAKLVQRMLRKMMQKKLKKHYLKHIDKVIFIQSCFRMVAAKQLALRLLRLKVGKYQEARKFQQKYRRLYNEKPAKRKKKLDRLLQEQKHQVLMKERIFIGEQVPQSQLDDREAQLAITGNGNKGRHRPAAGGLFQYKKDKDAPGNKKVQHQMSNLHEERRDKTVRALRYINKYKHLYTSANDQRASQEELRKAKIQQEQLPPPAKFIKMVAYQRDKTPNAPQDVNRSSSHKTPVREIKRQRQGRGSALRSAANKDPGIVKVQTLYKKNNIQAEKKPCAIPVVDKNARKSSIFLLQQIEHHDRILQEIKEVQERQRQGNDFCQAKHAQTTTSRSSLPFTATSARHRNVPRNTTKRDDLDSIVEQKLYESITSDNDKTRREEERRLLLHKTYGEKQSIRDEYDKQTERSKRTTIDDVRTIEDTARTPAGQIKADERRLKNLDKDHRVMLQTHINEKQRRFSPLRKHRKAKQRDSSNGSNDSTGQKNSVGNGPGDSPYAPQNFLDLQKHVTGNNVTQRLAPKMHLGAPQTGIVHRTKFEKIGVLTPLEGVNRAHVLRDSQDKRNYASVSTVKPDHSASKSIHVRSSMQQVTEVSQKAFDVARAGKNAVGVRLPEEVRDLSLNSQPESMNETPCDSDLPEQSTTDGNTKKDQSSAFEDKRRSRKRVKPINGPTDRLNQTGTPIMPYLVDGGQAGQLIMKQMTSKPSTDQLKRGSRSKLPRTGSDRGENLPLLKVGSGIGSKKATVAVLDGGNTENLFSKSIKAYQDQVNNTYAKMNKMKQSTIAGADEGQSVLATYKVSAKVAQMQHNARQSDVNRRNSRKRGSKRKNDEHSVPLQEQSQPLGKIVGSTRQGSEIQLYAVDLQDTSPSIVTAENVRDFDKRVPPIPNKRSSGPANIASRLLKGSSASLEANDNQFQCYGSRKHNRPQFLSTVNEPCIVPAIGKPRTSPMQHELAEKSVFNALTQPKGQNLIPTTHSPERYGSIRKRNEKHIIGGACDLSIGESIGLEDDEMVRDLDLSRNTDDSAILFVSDPTAQKEKDSSSRYDRKPAATEQKERHAAFLHQVSKKTARKIVEGYSKRLDGLTGNDELDQRSLGLLPENRLNQCKRHRFVSKQDETASPDLGPHLPSPGLPKMTNGYNEFINSNVTGPSVQPLDFSNVQIPKYFQARLQNPYDRSGTGELTSAHATTSHRQSRATAATYGMTASIPRKTGPPPSATSHFSSVFQKQQRQVAALNSTYNIKARKTGQVDTKQMDLIRKYGGNALTTTMSGMPSTTDFMTSTALDSRAVITPSQRGVPSAYSRKQPATKNSFLNGLNLGV